MGSGITQSTLEPIAFDGSTNSNISAITVTDFSQLSATLTSTIIVPPIVGDLLNGGVPAISGADGAWVQSITVGGVAYQYDQVSDLSSVSGGASNGSFNGVTNQWTVTTPEGAQLIVDMDTGDYSYTPPTSLSATTIEAFGYVVIDGDGDTASSTLTITVDPAAGPQVVRDDFVITNQDPTEIPDWALLANDQPSNGSSQILTGVSNPVSGSVTDNANDTVTFTNADGSFVYTNTSGTQSADGRVSVDHVSGTTLTGTYLDEILIGGTASETLNGGAGNDILIGGDGLAGFVIPRTVNAFVSSGSTYNGSNNQFSFAFAAGAGLYITEIRINVSGIGIFDQSGGNSKAFALGNLSTVSNAEINSVSSGDTTELVITFNANSFTVGDALYFGIDADGDLDDGGDFGDENVPFSISFSDGQTIDSHYQLS